MRPSRTAKLWIAAVGLAVIAAGCGSKKHPPASPTTTTATTAAPTTSAPTTSATAGTPPTSTGNPSTTTAGPCPTSQLTVTLGAGNGAAGSTYFTVNFLNRGTVVCTLNGYPGASYVTGSAGTQVGAAASRVATPGATQQTVQVAPGKYAHATLREINVGNYPTATCTPTAVLGLRIYPPNQTAAAFVAQTGTGCAQAGVDQLQIGFVVNGAG
jgi:hypothetical protein